MSICQTKSINSLFKTKKKEKIDKQLIKKVYL